ncbi:hypothetical protein OROGR_015853 [Orobanche gracilis]
MNKGLFSVSSATSLDIIVGIALLSNLLGFLRAELEGWECSWGDSPDENWQVVDAKRRSRRIENGSSTSVPVEKQGLEGQIEETIPMDSTITIVLETRMRTDNLEKLKQNLHFPLFPMEPKTHYSLVLDYNGIN